MILTMMMMCRLKCQWCRCRKSGVGGDRCANLQSQAITTKSLKLQFNKQSYLLIPTSLHFSYCRYSSCRVRNVERTKAKKDPASFPLTPTASPCPPTPPPSLAHILHSNASIPQHTTHTTQAREPSIAMHCHPLASLSPVMYTLPSFFQQLPAARCFTLIHFPHIYTHGFLHSIACTSTLTRAHAPSK